jgi:hypothetical protein
MYTDMTEGKYIRTNEDTLGTENCCLELRGVPITEVKLNGNDRIGMTFLFMKSTIADSRVAKAQSL